MAIRLNDEHYRRAEQIVHRWRWAVELSAPADRTVEQNAVAEQAVALLSQLLVDDRRAGGLLDAT